MKKIKNVIVASTIIAERRYKLFDKFNRNLDTNEKKKLQLIIVGMSNEVFMTAKEIKNKNIYADTRLEELKIDETKLLSGIRKTK